MSLTNADSPIKRVDKLCTLLLHVHSTILCKSFCNGVSIGEPNLTAGLDYEKHLAAWQRECLDFRVCDVDSGR